MNFVKKALLLALFVATSTMAVMAAERTPVPMDMDLELLSFDDNGVRIPANAYFFEYLPEPIFRQILIETVVSGQDPADPFAILKIIKQLCRLRGLDTKFLSYLTNQNIAYLLNTPELRFRGFDKDKAVNCETSPLFLASMKGYVEAVKILLCAGADKEKANVSEKTPLWIACNKGYVEVVRVLLAFGADKEAPDQFGNTPLHTACANGHKDVVKALLVAGADKEKIDSKRKTPLLLACCNNKVEVVRVLLEAGVEVNTLDAKGRSPLWIACLLESIELVKILLAHGAVVPEVLKNGLRESGFRYNRSGKWYRTKHNKCTVQ